MEKASQTVILPEGKSQKLEQPHGTPVELFKEGEYRIQSFVSPLNNRVRVLGYLASDYMAMRRALEKLADLNHLGKIFIKGYPDTWEKLEAVGFEREARILGYYNGGDATVLSLFPDPERRKSSMTLEQEVFLKELINSPPSKDFPKLPYQYTCEVAKPSDAVEMAALYEDTFETYPFPIFSPDYIRRAMSDNVHFRIFRNSLGRLVAAASAEINIKGCNAEMTDFATRPSERGKGLALCLLAALEGDMKERDILYLYTLSRSSSFGMNKVFHRMAYQYTGTLVKNCSIGGGFEDMHCWCKSALPNPSSLV